MQNCQELRRLNLILQNHSIELEEITGKTISEISKKMKRSLESIEDLADYISSVKNISTFTLEKITDTIQKIKLRQNNVQEFFWKDKASIKAVYLQIEKLKIEEDSISQTLLQIDKFKECPNFEETKNKCEFMAKTLKTVLILMDDQEESFEKDQILLKKLEETVNKTIETLSLQKEILEKEI